MTLASLPCLLLLAAGDPSAGRDLFTGARPFQGGAPPCGSCHGLGGQGLAASASLGPELSGSLAAMDPESLDGLLDALPFPTMVPVYDGRPLSPEERAHLTAFLLPAAQQGPPQGGWRFEALALLVAAALFLLVALAARGRKPPSRAGLLARARLVKLLAKGASR